MLRPGVTKQMLGFLHPRYAPLHRARPQKYDSSASVVLALVEMIYLVDKGH